MSRTEDDEVFCDEVHTTYLHELAHYLAVVRTNWPTAGWS